METALGDGLATRAAATEQDAISLALAHLSSYGETGPAEVDLVATQYREDRRNWLISRVTDDGLAPLLLVHKCSGTVEQVPSGDLHGDPA